MVLPKLPRPVHEALSCVGHFHTLVWIFESLGGGGLIALAIGGVQRALHSSVDWILIGVGFVTSSALFFFAIWLQHRVPSPTAGGAVVPSIPAPQQVGEPQPSGRELKDQCELRGQIRSLEDRLASAQEQVRKTRELSEKFWKLKESAREIRRRWTHTDFEVHPALRASWECRAGQPAPPWQQKALAWHKELTTIETFQVMMQGNAPYLTSLDFEGIMEVLDSKEREQQQLPVRNIQCGPSSPRIFIARCGMSRPMSCFFLTNQFDQPAYRAGLHAIDLGRRYSASHLAEVDVVLQSHGDSNCLLLDIRDEHGGGIAGTTALWHALQDRTTNSNGYKIPALVTLRFEDALGHTFVSRHSLEPHPQDHEIVTASFINVEELTLRVP